MISKMSDESALDMLMTSEFEDSFSPTEYKEMLLRYRYFYRILHSKYERAKSDVDFITEKATERIALLENRIFELEVQNAGKQDIINSMSGRKLTLKERLKGKIILDDEN